MELKYSDEVYLPREDSWALQKVVSKYITKNKPQRVLDMGTGCGIQAITAKIYGAKEVVGVDIDPAAIELAEKNAKLNKVDIKFIVSDLFERDIGEDFDLIVFNAPYLPPIPPLDPQWSGGEKFIEKFISQAKDHLAHQGKILFVYSSKSPVKFRHSVVSQEELEDGEILFIGKVE
tara:strand:+ start:265 stop:792 length:528 start_codon:yes stop_codon:yes gene_type:complete